MDKKPTWSNISNASSPSVEVKLPPATPLDLGGLCTVLDEGFKKHAMAASMEVADAVEELEKSVQELTNQLGAVGVGMMDNQKELVEQMSVLIKRLSTLDVSMEECAKNLDMIEDNLPVIANAIKAVKLDANIPITNLTVAMPKALVMYAVFAPVLFALLSLLISKLH